MNVHELAERLVSTVADDRGLQASVRREAGALRDLVTRNPDLALEHLEAIAARVVATLKLENPTADLAKCVGLENFWTYYLDPDVKAFVDSETYRRQVDRAANAGEKLARDLKTDRILIKAVHSWLVIFSDIEHLDGQATKVALAIRHSPPYAVLVFPLKSMLRAGVRVRTPRSLDAVPERLIDWREGGLASGARELIDADIPRDALGPVQWRP